MARLASLVVVLLFSLLTTAKADTIGRYYLNAGFGCGYPPVGVACGQITGTIDIDTDTGQVVDDVLYEREPYSYTTYGGFTFIGQNYYPGYDSGLGYQVDTLSDMYFSNGTGDISIYVNASLIGYHGGPICALTSDATCRGANHDYNDSYTTSTVPGDGIFNINNGSLTPAPEPPSLFLLTTGLAGLGYTIRRRGYQLSRSLVKVD